MTSAAISFLLWTIGLQAAAPADTAVTSAFKQRNTGAGHFAVLDRTGVTEELDLVIAMASPQALPINGAAWTWWAETQQIGIFLQEKTRPERVYFLGAKPGFPDCAARIERVTVTDTVISCEGEKSKRYPHQKWVYDVRAKELRGQFSYQPFAMSWVFSSAEGGVFLGSDSKRLVAVEYKQDRQPRFRILSEQEARPWIARGHPSLSTDMEGHFVRYLEDPRAPAPKIPALPKTTYDQFAAARPGHVKDGYVRGAEIHDDIGPWQREGERVWFGKSFYDGEGITGVGDLGYYDTSARKLNLFHLPELADWSVSAIEVEPGAVWMGLVNNGEWGGSSGGLLRYDRQSGSVRRFESHDVATRLVRIANAIVAATDFGITRVSGDEVERFFVDRTSDGRLRIAAAIR